MNMPVNQRDHRMRRWNIDSVRLNMHPVRGLDHRHGSPAAEDFRQHAFVCRRQMQNHHESHAAVGAHVIEKNTKRVDAASGGTDADDGEFSATSHRKLDASLNLGLQEPPLSLIYMIRPLSKGYSCRTPR